MKKGHNENMLVIKELSKSYGKNKALSGIDLDLVNGVYALLGPNGAGKSTLMNILTLSLRADEGKVLWKGAKRIEEAGKEYRGILGYMPQQQGLYDGFRGVDFLCYIAGLKDIPKKFVRDEVERVAKLVNLTDRLRDRVSGYSGGMKQRILFASAIIGNPEIVVLDEPTAGLDPRGRSEFLDNISELHQKEDMTVILVSHSMEDIARIADRVLVMDSGRVVYFDIPENVFSRVDELNALGLDAPQNYLLVRELEKRGIIKNAEWNRLYDEDSTVEYLKAMMIL
jgi:ABC-type multidrug transport system ATPase subunit